MTHLARLSEAQVRYLTEVDHVDHEAIAALSIEEPGQPGMGVARFVRLREDPEVAEAAVTVVDDYQGRGLGTILLVLMGGVAVSRGIRKLRAYVLEENQPMRHILEDLGAETSLDSPGVLRMDVPLPMRAEEIPDTAAARVLRAVASGLVAVLPTEVRLPGAPPSGDG